MKMVRFLSSLREEDDELLSLQKMLIDIGDLPGDDWLRKFERSRRVGIDGRRRPVGFLLRNRGLVVAIRTFEQQSTSRWVYVKLMSTTTSEQLQSALSHANVDVVTVTGSGAHINNQRPLDLDLDLGLTDVRAIEVTGTQFHETAIYRFVVGVVDQVIVTVGCSGYGDGWSLPDIRDVVSSQIRSISMMGGGR